MKPNYLLLAASTALATVACSGIAAAQSGDLTALQQRLDALEEQVQQLEARNLQLEADSDAGKKTAKESFMSKAGMAPNFAAESKDGKFSFNIRGRIHADWATADIKEGGYDFNSGTNIRRARIGVNGTAFTDFKYRLEFDLGGGESTVTDAYVEYAGFKNISLIAGQFKQPYTFDDLTSSTVHPFIERSLMSNSFSAGADRRMGAGVKAKLGPVNTFFAVSGENASTTRSDTAVDEGWGVNGKIYVEDKFGGVDVHLGGSGYIRTDNRVDAASPNSWRVRDRPGTRVDGGRIIDSGTILNVDQAQFFGAELAASYGPLLFFSEYGWNKLKPRDPLTCTASNCLRDDVTLKGYYLAGAWMITGEHRAFRNGELDGIKPKNNVGGGDGGLGAFELAFRYDHANFEQTIGSRAGTYADMYTTGLNWYFNPNFRLMVHWTRFDGFNTPLDPVGSEAKGDIIATRVAVFW